MMHSKVVQKLFRKHITQRYNNFIQNDIRLTKEAVLGIIVENIQNDNNDIQYYSEKHRYKLVRILLG